MSTGRAIQRVADKNAANFRAQIQSRGSNGWTVIDENGAQIKRVSNLTSSNWAIDTWVMVAKSVGGGYQILGRASNGPSNG